MICLLEDRWNNQKQKKEYKITEPTTLDYFLEYKNRAYKIKHPKLQTLKEKLCAILLSLILVLYIVTMIYIYL